MKIYHTTDIHANLTGFEGLIDLAISDSPCLVAVSGDYVNWPERIVTQSEWNSMMAPLGDQALRLAVVGSVLAVCSGNHELWASPREDTIGWPRSVISDSKIPEECSHLVRIGSEQCVVTCFPWCDEEVAEFESRMEIAECGRILRERAGGGPWVWLHHNPPAGTPVATAFLSSMPLLGCGSEDIACIASAYEPDAVLCGHIHYAPWSHGGAATWRDEGGATLWSNPGRKTTSIQHAVLVIA